MKKDTKESHLNKKVKQPPLLFDKTQSIVRRLEKSAGHRMLVYWDSDRGSLCQNDVIGLYEVFKKIGFNEQIFLFLKSGGGDVEATLRIVNLIHSYCHHFSVWIPLDCASAATMIALGADEIFMGPLAHLSAIDSSLRHDLAPLDERENRRVTVSQDELARIVKLWNKHGQSQPGNPYSDIFKYLHPLVIGAIDRASSLSIKICKEILSYHISDENECERISQHLNSDYPSHSYPITAREAQKIGLKVSSLPPDINDLLLDLSELYSEMAQRALTDYDESNYHDNEILNIIETEGVQIYYQNDKDWNYIKEERRWQFLNDESSWRKIEFDGKKTVSSTLHIR